MSEKWQLVVSFTAMPTARWFMPDDESSGLVVDCNLAVHEEITRDELRAASARQFTMLVKPRLGKISRVVIMPARGVAAREIRAGIEAACESQTMLAMRFCGLTRDAGGVKLVSPARMYIPAASIDESASHEPAIA